MDFQFEQLMAVIKSMGKEPTQVVGSSNFTPGSSQQVKIPLKNVSFTMQRDTMSPRQEPGHREMTPYTPTQPKVDRYIKVNVLEFDGKQGVDAFLDWKDKMKSLFRMYEVTEVRKLQFAKFKLTGTTRLWWSTYKKNHSKSGNGNITTQGEMKVGMKKRFTPRDYKKRAHMQLSQLRQGNSNVGEYTRQFQHFATRLGFRWIDEIPVSMYRQGLHPQILQSLCYQYYSSIDEIIQVVHYIEDNL